MKVYFDPATKGFYQNDIHSVIPSGAVEVTDEERWNLLKNQSYNTEIVVVDDKVVLKEKEILPEDGVGRERSWRDGELTRADIELYKVQDSDPKAIGTVAQWREYRKALRSYPESEGFPNKDKRPVAPDA